MTTVKNLAVHPNTLTLSQKTKQRLVRWGPLILILAVALLARLTLLGERGQHADIKQYDSWAITTYRYGLASLYTNQSDYDYPPVYGAVLGVAEKFQALRGIGFFGVGADPVYRIILRMPPLLGDLLLILIVYIFLIDHVRLRWLIPGLLAIHPGLILTSIWWSQPDALTAVLIVLILIALNRDQSLYAWAFFAVGMLFKIQTVFIVPLLLTLTFRRYGWRSLLRGAGIGALIGITIWLPELVGSGVQSLTRAYGVVGEYSKVNINALNLWMLVSPPTNPDVLASADQISDSGLFIGPMSYRAVGLLLLACYTLMIVVVVWRRYKEKREFVWAAALYLGVFMLPTEIHERYLLFGSVLLLIAVAQDRRLWPVALGVILTFTYNVAAVSPPPPFWYGIPFYPIDIAVEVALLNLVMLTETTRVLLTEAGQRSLPVAQNVIRVAAVIVVAAILISIVQLIPSYNAAQWLINNVADNSHLAFNRDAERVQKYTYIWDNAGSWRWDVILDQDNRTVSEWQGQGVQYLLVSDKSGDDLSQRVNQLTGKGATVVYRNDNPVIPGNHFAVMWTFHPDHPLNVTFDGALSLIGYSVVTDPAGQTGLLFHWYIPKPTSIAYHVFIHILGTDSEQIIGQADTTVGGAAHTTDSWRKNELIFDTVYLPSDALLQAGHPYHLRLGLYNFQTGVRAAITDDQSRALGDHLDVTLP